MFDRSELALKVLCGAMVAFVLYRLVLVIVHINPLYHVVIPALPTLPSAAVAGAASTNANSAAVPTRSGTNLTHLASAPAGTNALVHATNLVSHSTNSATQLTNAVAGTIGTVARATNILAHATNVVGQATNSLALGTNSVPGQAPARLGSIGSRPPGPGRMGMPPGGLPGMAKPGPELPPEMQARIDRVVDSEILAPVVRPMPMALLGIAGKDAFLRAPNGQTGLIKEGEELGGVKLVQIGINRVLVEEQGERKELSIFAGIGSESLLSTKPDRPK